MIYQQFTMVCNSAEIIEMMTNKTKGMGSKPSGNCFTSTNSGTINFLCNL